MRKLFGYSVILLLLLASCTSQPTATVPPTVTIQPSTPTPTLTTTVTKPTAITVTATVPVTATAQATQTSEATATNVTTTGGVWTIQGSRVIGPDGKVFTPKGINWYGAETGLNAPGGLRIRKVADILKQLKDLGFNALRLPYSDSCITGGEQPTEINYNLNPDLNGLDCWKTYQAIVKEATDSGFVVLTDRHQPDSTKRTPRWYTATLTEDQWIANLTIVAKAFVSNPGVAGIEIHNEPHSEGDTKVCWGCKDKASDWQLAAQKAAEAILKVNPKILIVVDGIDQYENNWGWYGGNLMGVKSHPVEGGAKDRVIYSAHDYPESVYAQAWFKVGDYPANLPAVWDGFWGYVIKDNIAPVWVTEFGSNLNTDTDRKWMIALVQYLQDNQMGWFLWDLNPESSDTGGLFQSDWKTVRPEMLQALQPLLAR